MNKEPDVPLKLSLRRSTKSQTNNHNPGFQARRVAADVRSLSPHSPVPPWKLLVRFCCYYTFPQKALLPGQRSQRRM